MSVCIKHMNYTVAGHSNCKRCGAVIAVWWAWRANCIFKLNLPFPSLIGKDIKTLWKKSKLFWSSDPPLPLHFNVHKLIAFIKINHKVNNKNISSDFHSNYLLYTWFCIDFELFPAETVVLVIGGQTCKLGAASIFSYLEYRYYLIVQKLINLIIMNDTYICIPKILITFSEVLSQYLEAMSASRSISGVNQVGQGNAQSRANNFFPSGAGDIIVI